jgi:pectin methylesterase-like acyl-CoA thioesterase
LYAQNGAQLYARSLIVGAVDFIFGKTALAWFHGCDIRTIGPGCVTASGRDSATNPSWYVISKSDIRGINATFDAEALNYLGRPWQNYSRVVVQESYLGKAIAPAGWSIWNPGDPRTNHIYYGECANYGPGSASQEGPRANFSMQLASPMTIESVLGANWRNEFYVDASYMD